MMLTAMMLLKSHSANSTADEEETFQATNLAQENHSKTFQEQVKPAVETASQTVNQFANQTGETFQQASKTLNETWKKQDKKTQTNLIMLAIASIPVILWALGMILFGIASDELSGGIAHGFSLRHHFFTLGSTS